MNLNPLLQINRQVVLTIPPLAISQLRVNFSIDLSLEPEPNRATFTVCNLSATSRSAIMAEMPLMFAAGYVVPQPIFIGRIASVKHRRVPTGWETEIEALDGHTEMKHAKFDVAFPAGTPLQTIIAAMAATLGLPFELGFIPANNSIMVGTTYSGTTFKCLNQITKQLNLQWSVQQGVLYVSDKNQPPISAMAQFVLLSPDTGLIGSPVVTMEEEPEELMPVGSIEAVALLNPKLLPNKPVKIAPTNPMSFAGVRIVKGLKVGGFSVTANGVYRISRARFVGSNIDGVFNSEIVCPIWSAA
jgi:hypothetical protein